MCASMCVCASVCACVCVCVWGGGGGRGGGGGGKGWIRAEKDGQGLKLEEAQGSEVYCFKGARRVRQGQGGSGDVGRVGYLQRLPR